MRAGPRSRVVFRGPEVRAAIVTCGGLCPGINNVIRYLPFYFALSAGCSVLFGLLWLSALVSFLIDCAAILYCVCGITMA